MFKNPPGKREVTALALGGPVGSKDRIYAAFGQTIQGVNKKKGAQFFLYSTVLNEDISSLYVEDLTIYTACEYSLNVFEANKNGDQVSDVHFYQAPDKIHSMSMTRIPGAGNAGGKDGASGYNSVLGCQDKHLRVVRDSTLFYEARVDGAVLSTQMYDGNLPPEKKTEDGGTMAQAIHFKINSEYKSVLASEPTSEQQVTERRGEQRGERGNRQTHATGGGSLCRVSFVCRQVIYGTDNGLVGQYFLDSSSMRPGFLLGSGEKKSSVTSLALCDVTLSGFDDLVVGRDDGRVEVFPYDLYEPSSEAVFSRDLHESVTSIERGQIVANNSMDLVVSTYSGKVMAFTHEMKHSAVGHIAPKVSNLKDGSSSATATTSTGLPGSITHADGSSTNVMKESAADLDKSIKELRLELEKLTERVAKEKEKYASKVSAELIAVEQQFKLKHSFKLLADEACYLLTLEVDLPLDVVTLQSNIPVMLLDVEANRAMLSRTDRDEKNGNELLATYRVQQEDATTAAADGAAISTRRMEIKIRTVEGQHGTLSAYVIPKLQPKSCQKLELRIKPLSLHEKVHREVVEGELRDRPLSTLSITGSFTLSDAHSWVTFCLPDVSNKLAPASDGPQLLYFRSTFLRTVLVCEYEKGKASFKSDSATAISILKEVSNHTFAHTRARSAKHEASYCFSLDLISLLLS